MKVILRRDIIKEKTNKEGRKMELLQLRYFCDAARNQNFSKTAKKYTVPPSNISQSVKRLETELGYPLFSRHANKIILNVEGERFFNKVSKALEMIDEAASSHSDDGLSGNLSISVNSNRRIVMEAIEKFKKLYPAVNIKTAYFGNLESEDYSIIIDSDSSNIAGYRKEILFSEDIALAVNADSPLAKAKKIDISKLKNEAFITMNSKASMYRLTNEICASHGFEPKIALQSDDPVFVRKCVELGLGIAFAPTLSWKGQFPENVVLKNLNYRRAIYIFINEKTPFSVCVKNFVNMLRAQI